MKFLKLARTERNEKYSGYGKSDSKTEKKNKEKSICFFFLLLPIFEPVVVVDGEGGSASDVPVDEVQRRLALHRASLCF